MANATSLALRLKEAQTTHGWAAVVLLGTRCFPHLHGAEVRMSA